MSRSVDEKVIEMKFNNKNFEKNANQSIKTLSKLKSSLKLEDTSKSLKELEKAAKTFTLDDVGKNVDKLSKRFSNLGVVGMSILNKMTTAAINFGKSITNFALTPLNQIKSGGITRALNIEQAEFQLEGLKKNVKAYMASVSEAVSGTAFGLDEAAKVASQLAASGKEAGDELTGTLKGIAGLAAMTGSSFEDIGNIYTTIAGNGRLMSDQLLQLSSRGINAAATLAEYLGVTEKEVRDLTTKGAINFDIFAKAMDNAFGEHSKKANETFTGAMSNVNAALSRIGQAFATPYFKNMRDILNAIIPALNDVKDALGPVITDFEKFAKFANVFINSILNIKKRSEVLSNIVQGLVNILYALLSVLRPIGMVLGRLIPARNDKELVKLSESFKEFTSQLIISKKVAKTISNMFIAVWSIIKTGIITVQTIIDVFKTFFTLVMPSGTTVISIFDNLSKAIINFSKYTAIFVASVGYIIKYLLTLGYYTNEYFGITTKLGNGIEFIFKSLVSIVSFFVSSTISLLSMLETPIIFIWNVLFTVFTGVKDGISSIISASKPLVNAIVNIRDVIASIFNNGSNIKVVEAAATTKDTIEETTNGLNGFTSLLQTFTSKMSSAKSILDVVKVGLNTFIDFVKLAIKTVSVFISQNAGGVFSVIGKGLMVVVNALKSFAANITPGNIAATLFIASMIGMSVAIMRFIKSLEAIPGAIAGVLTSTKKVLDSTSSLLNAVTEKVKGTVSAIDVIKELEKALLILVGTIYVLSKIPVEDLNKALVVLLKLVGGVVLLTAALVALSSIAKKAGLTEGMAILSASTLSFAATVAALSVSLKIISTLPIDGLEDRTNIILKVISAFVLSMSVYGHFAQKSVGGAAAILSMSISVLSIAKSIKEIADLDLEKIQAGVYGYIALLGALSIAALAMSRIKGTAGLGALAVVVAMKLLLKTTTPIIAMLSSLKPTAALALINGFFKVLSAISLGVIITGALFRYVAPAVSKVSSGLLMMSASIILLTTVCKLIQNIGWSTMGKAAAFIAGVGVLFAAFMTLSQFTKDSKMLSFGAGILMLSSAVTMLTGFIFIIGSMKDEVIAKGTKSLLLILGAFAVIELISGQTAKAKPEKLGIFFLMLSGSLTIMTGLIYLLGNIDDGVLVKGTITLGLMLSMVVIIETLSNKTEKANFKGLNAFMVLTMAVLAEMAVIVSLLGSIDDRSLTKGVLSLTIMEVVFGMFIRILASLDFTIPWQGLVAIGEAILALGGIAASLRILNGLNIVSLGASVLALSAVMASLESIITSISSKKTSSSAIAALAVASGSILTIAVSLALLSNFSWASILASCLAINVTLANFNEIFNTIVRNRSLKNAMTNIKLFEIAAASLVIIGTALALASIHSWSSILASSLAINSVLLSYTQVFEQIAKMKNLKNTNKNIAMFTLASLSIAVIGGALSNVAKYNWASILVATFALNSVLAAYTKQFNWIMSSPATPGIEKRLLSFVLAATVLNVIGNALGKLGAYNWEGLAAAGFAIGFVLKAYTTAFNSVMNTGSINLKGLIGFELMVVGTIPIIMGIAELAKYDYRSLIAASSGVTALLASFAVIIKVLQNVNPVGAATAALDMVVFIGILTAIVVALGALMMIPEMEQILKDGGKAFALIGEAIGGFAGGIVAGFVKEAVTALPAIGTALSEFMINATPFFMGLEMIDLNGIGEGIKSIAEALIIMAAKDFMDAITSLFGGRSSLETIGGSLTKFGTSMIEFGAAVSGMDTEAVIGAANAGKALAEFAAAVPNEGGFAALFAGENDVTKFGKKLPEFGGYLAEFANAVHDVSKEDIEKGASSGKMLAEFAKSIPNEGGWLGEIVGDNNLSVFGSMLPGFGENLSLFAKNVKDLEKDDVEKGTYAGKLLASLAKSIPNEGGWLGEIVGDNNLSVFGGMLPGFGLNLATFVKNIKDIDPSDTEKATTMGNMLVALAKTIPNSGGVVGFFSGDNDLRDFAGQLPGFGLNMATFARNVQGIDESSATSANNVGVMLANLANSITGVGKDAWYNLTKTSLVDFGKQLPKFGSKLKEFVDSTAGMNLTSANSITQIINALLNVISKIPGSDSSIKNFSTSLTSLGNGYKDFSNSVSKITNTEFTSTFVKNISEIIKITKKISKVDTSSIKGFTDGIKGLSKMGVKNIQSSTKSSIEAALKTLEKKSGSFNTIGKNFMDSLMKGFDDEGEEIINSRVKKVVKHIRSGLSNDNNQFTKSGKNVLRGYLKGIKNEELLEKISKASAKIGKISLEALKEELDIHSPSYKFGILGTFSSLGYAEGLMDGSYFAKGAAKSVGKDSIKALDEQASKANIPGANFIATFVDTLKDKAPNVYNAVATIAGNTTNVFGTNLIDGIKNITKEVSEPFDKLLKGDLGGVNFDSYLKSAQKQANKSSESIGKIADQALGKDLLKSTNKKKSSGVKFTKSDLKEAKKSYKDIIKVIEEAFKPVSASLMKQSNQVINSVKVVPSAITTYIKNYQTADKYAAGVVKSFNNNFKNSISTISKEAKSSVNTYSKQLDKLAKKRDKYNKILESNKSSKKQKKNAKKQLKDIETQITTTTKLYNKAASQVSGKALVSAFADSLYMKTDSYKESKKNLENYTKELKKGQKQAEKYNKVISSKKASTQAKKNAASALKSLQTSMKTAQKNINSEAKKMAKGSKAALKEFRNEIKETVKSITSLSNINFSNTLITGFDAYEKTTSLTQEVTKKFDALSVSLETSSSSFDIFDVNLEEVSDGLKDAADSFDIFSASCDTGINMLETFTKTGTVEVARLMEDAKGQLEAYSEFQNGIKELESKGISQSVIDDLESQGPSALNYIRGFLNMSADEVEAYNELVAEKREYEGKTLERNLNKQLNQYEDYAKDVEDLAAKGLSAGIIDKLKEAGIGQAQFVKAMTSMDSATLSNVSALYGKIVSTSVTTGIGQSIKTGTSSFLQAIKDNLSEFETWKNNLQKLLDAGLDTEIIDRLREMGIEGSKNYIASIFKDMEESNEDVITQINTYYKKYSKDTVQSYRDALKSQVNKYEQWNENIKQLIVKGYNSTLVSEIESMGMDSAGDYVTSMLQETYDGVKEINDLYNKSLEKQKTPVQVLLENLKSQNQAMSQYRANLKKLLARVGNDVNNALYKEVAAMGIDGAELVETLVKATNTEFTEISKEYKKQQDNNAAYNTLLIQQQATQMSAAAKQYEADINKLTGQGIAETLLSDLMAQGPEAIRAVAEMDNKAFQAFNSTYLQQQALTKQITDDIVANYAATSLKIGQNVATGMANGVSKKSDKAVSAATKMCKATITAANNALEIKSPSKKFIKIGKYIDDGLVNGIKDKTKVNNVTKAAADVAKSALNSAKKALGIKSPSKEFEQVGKYSDEGMANGLIKSLSYITNAIDTVSNQAINEALNSFDLTEVANSFLNTFADGVVGDSGIITTAIDSVGNMSSKTMNDTLSQIVKVLNGNIDTNPIITPKLDLSYVKSGAQQINSLLNNMSSTIGVDSVEDDDNNKPVGGMSFVQNIYSPKQLSRFEIYRQTRNQFAQAKGLVET